MTAIGPTPGRRQGPPFALVVQLPDDTSTPDDLTRLLVETRRAIGGLPPGTQVTACLGDTAQAVLDALNQERP